MVQELHEKLDYSFLITVDELTHYDDSKFPQEEVAEAVLEGLLLCDEYDIDDVVDKDSVGADKKWVDTKWNRRREQANPSGAYVGANTLGWRCVMMSTPQVLQRTPVASASS